MPNEIADNEYLREIIGELWRQLAHLDKQVSQLAGVTGKDRGPFNSLDDRAKSIARAYAQAFSKLRLPGPAPDHRVSNLLAAVRPLRDISAPAELSTDPALQAFHELLESEFGPVIATKPAALPSYNQFLHQRACERLGKDEPARPSASAEQDYLLDVERRVADHYRSIRSDHQKGPILEELFGAHRNLLLIELLDAIDRLTNGLPDWQGRLESLAESVRTLFQLQLIPVRIRWDTADSRLHEILGSIPTDERDLDRKVLAVRQTGYRRQGVVIRRPAVEQGMWRES